MGDVTVLEVDGLRTEFAGQGYVVNGVSFAIARGKSLVLLGESGSGKSTIALSIMRLLAEPAGRIRGGRVVFEGMDLLRIEERRMRRIRGRRIGMVFQDPQSALNPVLTIGTQLGECLPGKEHRTRGLALLEAVGLPDPTWAYGAYPHQLSGGMRQRVVIAMAIAAEPALLIADEPTSALDVTIQAQILELIKSEQRRRDMSVLFVTHDLGVAHLMADEVAVLYRGTVMEQASRTLLFSSPQHPYTRDLFAAIPSREKRGASLVVPDRSYDADEAGCRYAGRCRYVQNRCRGQEPELREGPDGVRVRCVMVDTPRAPSPDGAPGPDTGGGRAGGDLLDADGLCVNFTAAGRIFGQKRQIRVVNEVSLRIGRGRTLALVGESGSGKTTLGKAIIRLLPLAGGRLRFQGEDMTCVRGEVLRRWRRDIQMIFQDPYASLDPRMTVGEIVAEGLRAQRALSAASRSRRVQELLRQVGIAGDSVDRYPHQFSGGQRQRIAIARALAVQPKLIICDEPTSALDVSVQAQILNLLRDLQREAGLSYLFITHNLALVAYLAHDVAILYAGRIIERGSADQILKNPHHPYTVSLFAAAPRFDHPLLVKAVVKGEASPEPVTEGCPFHPRCSHALPHCQRERPLLRGLEDGHEVACHLWDQEETGGRGF
ncbi:MAG: dipeptide ABC transporter ATP-binding protein [Acidiferrobacteraceae bacterium]